MSRDTLYYALDGSESISLQYNVLRSIVGQFRTVMVIVLSLALQDVAREFYLGGQTEPVDRTNFFIMFSIALIGIIMSTIFDAFVRSWETRDIKRWKDRVAWLQQREEERAARHEMTRLERKG